MFPVTLVGLKGVSRELQVMAGARDKRASLHENSHNLTAEGLKGSTPDLTDAKYTTPGIHMLKCQTHVNQTAGGLVWVRSQTGQDPAIRCRGLQGYQQQGMQVHWPTRLSPQAKFIKLQNLTPVAVNTKATQHEKYRRHLFVHIFAVCTLTQAGPTL
jgi:hypothetical protein